MKKLHLYDIYHFMFLNNLCCFRYFARPTKKAVESLADVSLERLQQAVLGDLLGHLPKSLMFYTKGAPKKILESVPPKK